LRFLSHIEIVSEYLVYLLYLFKYITLLVLTLT